jgi:hypothetical protein
VVPHYVEGKNGKQWKKHGKQEKSEQNTYIMGNKILLTMARMTGE